MRDTEYIWCTGVIEKIVKTSSKKERNCLLFVHYHGWSRVYDEYIWTNSDRIAPEGTYTARKDIPQYDDRNLNEERVYGRVLDPHNE